MPFLMSAAAESDEMTWPEAAVIIAGFAMVVAVVYFLMRD